MAHRVRRAATYLRDSHTLHGFARAGFVTNGLLHAIIGGLAFAIAFGEHPVADHDGALAQLASGPLGWVLILVAVVALFGLALFQLLTVALIRGRSLSSWAARAKPGSRALAYLGLGYVALRYALGNSPRGSEAQAVSAGLLSLGGGVILVAVIGLVIFIAGVSFVVIGIRRRFVQDIAPPNRWLRRIARGVGLAGYVAEGVALMTVGVLFFIAAYRQDASSAGGLDGALEALRRLPSGNVVLSVVAAGFILYGVYCFMRGAWERLRPAAGGSSSRG